MSDQKHTDPRWLSSILQRAVDSFNNNSDVQLLMDEDSDDGERHGAVGERAIAHRFAVHLERVLQDFGYPNEAVKIATDCEYNRHRGAVKQHHVKEKLKKRVEDAHRTAQSDPKREGWYVFSVSPDIIVHERGVDEKNLIVIEMKRASNSFDDDYDKLKLELFTKQGYDDGYGYRLGASIVALDQGGQEERKLIVAARFIDGKQVA